MCLYKVLWELQRRDFQEQELKLFGVDGIKLCFKDCLGCSCQDKNKSIPEKRYNLQRCEDELLLSLYGQQSVQSGFNMWYIMEKSGDLPIEMGGNTPALDFILQAVVNL